MVHGTAFRKKRCFPCRDQPSSVSCFCDLQLSAEASDFMSDLSRKLRQCAKTVKENWTGRPVVGIVLGSGLGGLSDFIQIEAAFETGDLPHYPKAAAMGHRGRFLCGTLDGVGVAVVDGRPHFYEGFSADEVALPVRLMMQLGAQTLVISNASGAVNPELAVGDVVILKNHINLMWKNPLIGENDDSVGPRFPDMSSPYDPTLGKAGADEAEARGFPTASGVYFGLVGPNYETSAEYRMARFLGADVVGMSTVPEVLAAQHAGARVLAASVVSNVHSPGAGPVSGEEVVDVVAKAEPVMQAVVAGVLQHIQAEPEPFSTAESNSE